MADRWMDERDQLDRMDRERRYGRYRRDEYSAGDYGSSDYDDRSFQPRDRDRDRDRRGPVFGERESGTDYTGPRYGAGGYTGAPRYDRGRDGGRGYREEYRPSSSITRGGAYDYARNGSDRDGDQRWRDERAYRVAYGDHHPDHADHAGHYEGRGDRDADRREDGRSFWERAGDRFASWFGESDYDDRRDRGEHRGRGPSGYKRADERINDEVHERLTDDPWVDASAIAISVSEGEVTLSGTVPEREAKHRAERIVENLSGVTHVQNNLRVTRGNPLTDPGRGFGDAATATQMSSHPITSEGSDPTLRAAKAGLDRSN